MEIVKQYVLRQLREIEEEDNDNTETQVQQLQRYFNKLKIVLTETEYQEVLTVLTESKQGQKNILSSGHTDLRKGQVKITIEYNRNSRKYDYKFQFMNKDTNKVIATITKKLVRGL
ncbi:MAG: hypothetical protein ACRCW1_05120 [Anaerotignaceae bacterium]